MGNDLTRADLLKIAGAAVAGAALAGCGAGGPAPSAPGSTAAAASIAATPSSSVSAGAKPAYLGIAKGSDPAAITRAAIDAVGGIGRFVKKGADVIVKPNICTAYHGPEYAATSNPDVVATLVRLCFEAGAKRVRVMDWPFSGSMQDAYLLSGIGPAVEKAGGTMEIMSPVKFSDTAIPKGRSIKSWPVYRDVLTCDTLIDVPIPKTHSTTTLTLGMKNLMGIIDDRGSMHANLNQNIADLTSAVMPTLTVIDAYRVLTRGGPTGGDLGWVKETHTVAASHDIVAADTYGASLLGRRPQDVPCIPAAAAMKLGTTDLKRVDVRTVHV